MMARFRGWAQAALAVAIAVAVFAAPWPGTNPAPPMDQGRTGGPLVEPPSTPLTPPSGLETTVLFGLDAGSLAAQRAHGLTPAYASLWVGVWNLDKGWRDTDAQLRELRSLGITPAVHFYYWGDTLSPACLESGCNGKTMAGWDLLATQLATHLQATLEGGPVLVVLETEFNKASVARSEPLDALLAAKATYLKSEYPAAQVVLGLGNWNPGAWASWDRAAAASDAVGLQALAGSARGIDGGDPGMFNATLAGVKSLAQLFGKPIVLQDVAAPSAPFPASPATQSQALTPFIDRLAELEEAGVQAILYRSFLDSPNMSLAHFFGEAERHFGLAAADTGALKPAGEVWVAALRMTRPVA
jgi:hypothetical protein